MKAEIYGREDCKYCQLSKLLCKDRFIEYRYYNISVDEKYKQEMFSRMDIIPKTVPQIFVDDIYIGGYTEFYDYINNKG